VVFDADEDRYPDVIVAFAPDTGEEVTIAALQNQGNGALRTAKELAVGKQLAHVIAGDFDADDKMDVAAMEVESSSSRIVLLWNRSAPPASRDENQNGVPDECGDADFNRADPNDDGEVDISDALFILQFLFLSGDAPACMESSDANDDGGINIGDPICILHYLFLGVLGANSIPPPGPPGDGACGPDPADSPAFLGCHAYTHCP
jgi:hypothetical protein